MLPFDAARWRAFRTDVPGAVLGHSPSGENTSPRRSDWLPALGVRRFFWPSTRIVGRNAPAALEDDECEWPWMQVVVHTEKPAALEAGSDSGNRRRLDEAIEWFERACQ